MKKKLFYKIHDFLLNNDLSNEEILGLLNKFETDEEITALLSNLKEKKDKK